MEPSELTFRLGVFLFVLVTCALAEIWFPRRARSDAPRARWISNLSLVALGVATVRLMGTIGSVIGVPLVAVAAAVLAERHGIGLLNSLAWPAPIEFLAGLLVLDFAIWLQHLAAHKIPVLWRVHRMHHADRDFDVTTALRFHPIEIGLSMLYKVAWVLIIGASPLTVMVFEIILNACAMFNHSNLRLPNGADRFLRALIVTPDMHRVHHSVHSSEHHANYGFNLSIWDRLFGTYVDQPRDGHLGMTIGLRAYDNDAPSRLGWCLKLPFAPHQPRANRRSDGATGS